MPITPKFSLSQTDSHIIVDIRVPHIRVSVENLQVVVEDDRILHFASPPYLLLLNFAAYQFAELADENCATYAPDHNGTITLKLQKKQPGLVWENLDLLGNLMQTHSNNNRGSSKQQQCKTAHWIMEQQEQQQQQQVTTVPVVDDDDEANNQLGDEEESRTGNEDIINRHKHNTGYGFGRMFRGIFSDLNRDGMAQEMLARVWDEGGKGGVTSKNNNDDDHDDHGTSSTSTSSYRHKRIQQRLSKEEEDFSEERYLQDLEIEDDYFYQCAIQMVPHWMATTTAAAAAAAAKDDVCSSGNTIDSITQGISKINVDDQAQGIDSSEAAPIDASPPFFTPDEKLQLSTIPYPLLPSKEEMTDGRIVVANLVDILYAYVYDHLLTDGDPTVESSWTISILSANLSWLEEHTSLEDAVVCSIRRSLAYPYLRNYEFGRGMVWGHVRRILQAGLRTVVRCLLQTRRVLEKSEIYYLSNKLYIDPYLAWLQQNPLSAEELLQDAFQELGKILEEDNCHLKSSLGLNLVVIEASLLENSDDDGTSRDSSDDSSSDSSDDDSSGSSSSESDDDDNDVGQEDCHRLEEQQRRPISSLSEAPSMALLDENIGTTSSLLVSTIDKKNPDQMMPTEVEGIRRLIQEL